MIHQENKFFNASKYEYETALKNSSYQQTKSIFNNKKEHRMQKQNCRWNMIWFNPPLNRNVTILSVTVALRNYQVLLKLTTKK